MRMESERIYYFIRFCVWILSFTMLFLSSLSGVEICSLSLLSRISLSLCEMFPIWVVIHYINSCVCFCVNMSFNFSRVKAWEGNLPRHRVAIRVISNCQNVFKQLKCLQKCVSSLSFSSSSTFGLPTFIFIHSSGCEVISGIISLMTNYIKYVFMFEVLISVPFFLMCLKSFAQLYIVVFFYVF